MKLTNLAFTVLLAMGTYGYADHHEGDCSCDTACQEKCAEGKGGESCDCKTCDCAKSGKCEHAKCDHKHGKQDKKAAKPAKK